MSKILHSFTLAKKSSDLIKQNSRPKEMSKQVSKAIEWYFTGSIISKEYNDDGEWTGKYTPGSHGSVLASGQERYKYEKIIKAYMAQIDDLRLECATLRNNRFKFWKKTL